MSPSIRPTVWLPLFLLLTLLAAPTAAVAAPTADPDPGEEGEALIDLDELRVIQWVTR